MRFATHGLCLVVAFAAALAARSAEGGAGKGTTPAVVPPGGAPGDGGPSFAVFPPERVPLRFDHKVHAAAGAACITCHPGGTTSTASGDRLLPKPAVCDSCHGTNHTSLVAVAKGNGQAAACSYCHEGHREGSVAVAAVTIPAPNLHFSHAAHAARSIGCAQCHGAVEERGKATRDALPRMRGCLRCHDHPVPLARGDAQGACETCHLAAPFGEHGAIRTAFPSGKLLPPRWMHGAEHTPDFLARHKLVAGNDSTFCGSCHREDFCVDCHDGRVRPRTIHPNDYVSMHGVEARLAASRCESCHRDQSFCVTCHMRTGASATGPVAVRTGSRFHPPKEVWSDGPTRGGHHGREAARNMNACVSCHTERDCVSCHGARGIGAGVSPHPPGFRARCAAELATSSRPCLTCHREDELAACL